MHRTLAVSLAVLAMAAAPLAAQEVQPAWDGLVKVEAKKLDEVYLRPEADFRDYTKVLIDPTEVAFRKNWLRDQNRERLDLANRVSDSDARRILDEAQRGFQRLFAEAYMKAGYEVAVKITYRDKATSLDAEVARLKAANADVFLPSSYTNDAILFVRTAKKLDYSPRLLIAQNAGWDGAVVAGKLIDGNDDTLGFNAQTETYENLVQAGVIDPTKVVRTALQDAASVAGLLITTEATIAEVPEDKPAAPMGGMGGMGGMDF